ncbi:hypothetical protein LHU53_12985 [Rhodoferax sp. U2-2l]|uniref:hypothetical protein n=1 Tax=Rhodoferax sp. U2-2l TaxID=2884000 RepID=UPI001D0A36A1|nr:hypothetical protein [Rhodoferax sp. U2-2l]MCB8747819.1 hypothetical protein [Rhodoferax sp. U2-2l]
MIDISGARLQPFQAFHSFHERINVHIKVAHAANVLLVRHVGEPNNQDQLAELITSCHPSWNAPPVRNLSIDLQRAQDASVSAFAVVSVFSAFDDFLISTEAEISRVVGNQRTADPTSDESDASEDDEEKIDRVFRLYAFMSWSDTGITELQPLLRYFRICRNCIAHRNGRASKALATQSADPRLAIALAALQDGRERGVMTFKVNEAIHVAPTLAIMCSHILRLIAIDANNRLVETLGLDGILKSVAHHAVRLNDELGGKDRKRPEAIVNAFLTKSRVHMDSRQESIAEMKRVGVWTPYLKAISRGLATSNRSVKRTASGRR